MQVLAGARNRAELAFLNDFTAEGIQSALLELLTTNFVGMSTSTSGGGLDTVYQLSEFARKYLDKHHAVTQDERNWLLARHDELRELGSQLAADSSVQPYSASTVHVRGIADVHVARLLKEAIKSGATDPGVSLQLCIEAQLLAPSYYEAWRVEALIRSAAPDDPPRQSRRTNELLRLPESPVLHYHYGNFLLDVEAGDPRGGLRQLQTAAGIDRGVPAIVGQIAWAHYSLGDMRASVDSSSHVLRLEAAGPRERKAATTLALRATTRGVREALDTQDQSGAAELLEQVCDLVDGVGIEALKDEIVDRLGELSDLAGQLSGTNSGYPATKAPEYRNRLTEWRRRADPNSLDRRIGRVRSLKPQNGFGFIMFAGRDYFFHYRDLVDFRDSNFVAEGATCAFLPTQNLPRGPKALEVRVLI